MDIEEKFKGKLILTIDDSMTIRNYLCNVLTPLGAQVDEAANAESGLMRTRTEDYDLILLDLLLPDMDGMEVLKRLREQNQTSAIVMLTGTGGIRSATTAMQEGADGYLEKQDMISSEQAAFFYALAQALERRHTIIVQKRLQAEIAVKVEQLKISEKRAMEANMAKSTFLASMSHELRTPLNAILGFVQLLQRDSLLNREQRKYLSIIMSSGEHLLGLINDVLSLSKIEAGKIKLNEQIYDIHRLLQNLAETFLVKVKSKGLTLKFEIDPQLPQNVRGDESKLRQVIINLLGNATKFTETGGIILRMRWHNNRAAFEVADTGYGIASYEMENLFEPFVQTESGLRSKEGTGLGLAISRHFVQLMGGEFKVISELGKGSTFYFEVRLPRAAQLEVKPEYRRVKSLMPGQPQYRILVADDRWESRTPLARLISSIGFQVKEANNGQEAIDLWRQWQPHLIWMDMRMSMVDGYTATRQIRSQEQLHHTELINQEHDSTTLSFSHVPIVAVTANALEQDRDAILSSGCDDFVAKPFRETIIFEKMAKYLGVEYLYEELMPKVTQEMPIVTSSEIITMTALAALPEELRLTLNQALELGDLAATRKAIDQIQLKDETLAGELRELLDTFRLEELQAIVDQG